MYTSAKEVTRWEKHHFYFEMNNFIGFFAEWPTADLVHELAQLRNMDCTDSNEGAPTVAEMIEAIELEINSR